MFHSDFGHFTDWGVRSNSSSSTRGETLDGVETDWDAFLIPPGARAWNPNIAIWVAAAWEEREHL